MMRSLFMRIRFVSIFLTAVALVAPLALACGKSESQETAVATPAAPAAAGSAATPSATVAGRAELRLLPSAPAALGAPAVPPAATSSSPTAVPYEPAVVIYNAYGTDAAPGVFPRTVRHAMGETTIKAAPQRVVVLDTGEMDAVVEMGLIPVATLDYSSSGLPPYLEEKLRGVKTVGSLAEPNLEAIAALRPDLILSNKLRHEKIYDKLAAIAPTIFGERAGLVWRHNVALYAQALGREEQAAASVRQYEERARELNAKLPTPRPSVSIVRVMEKDLRYYQRANFIGGILTDLGFPRPESQNVDDFALLNMSLETAGQHAPADLIAVSIWPNEENPFGRQLLESPIWKAIPAVQQGRVMLVNDRVWMAGLGYRAAQSIFDDIAAHFGIK
jgi:iron complex transport system substrate-binding protein